ncbi:hypothetical protein [Streptomyces sp. IMTB 1903]|uniref:hypothetical protein n=1 Tax=Streptomyces sp. IMTB 1903 TaxID=1776680 RepID=UPI00075DDE3D|nr:hypothetical protein [Streptomyces sp. IMTB 1903]
MTATTETEAAAERAADSWDGELRILRELFRPGNRLRMAVIALLAAVSAAATLALPLVVAELVQQVQQGQGLTRAALLMIGTGRVFDTQETLADMLCQTAAYGHDATWLMRLPRALREAPLADVSRAAVRMVAERPLTALVVRTDAADLTETADMANTDEAARALPGGRAV